MFKRVFKNNISIKEKIFIIYIFFFVVVMVILKNILFFMVWCILKFLVLNIGDDSLLVLIVDYELLIFLMR